MSNILTKANSNDNNSFPLNNDSSERTLKEDLSENGEKNENYNKNYELDENNLKIKNHEKSHTNILESNVKKKSSKNTCLTSRNISRQRILWADMKSSQTLKLTNDVFQDVMTRLNCQDMICNNSHSQKSLCKRSQSYDAWYSSQMNFLKNKLRKIKDLETKHNIKESSTCTFFPSVNVYPNYSQNYRTADEFFDDQIKYKTNSINKIKVKIANNENDENNIFVPNISSHAKKISKKARTNSESYLSRQVYDRLADTYSYSNNQEEGSTTMKQRPNSFVNNFSFTPSINLKSSFIKRDEEAFKLLYKDALKRLSNHDLKVKKFDKKIKNETNQSFVLTKSHKILFKKFNTEFEEAFSRVASESKLLSYIETISLMTMLGFVNIKSKKADSNDRFLLYDMWHLMKGDELGGISRRNAQAFLLSVLGFYSEWMSQSSTNSNQSKLPFIIIEEEYDETLSRNALSTCGKVEKLSKDFTVSKKDAGKIHHYFRRFFLNKIDYEKLIRNIGNEFQINQMNKPKFKPTINSNSEKMSNDFINKTINKITDSSKNQTKKNISRVDFLNLKGAEYESKINKLRVERERNSSLNATFKPKLITSSFIKPFKNLNLNKIEVKFKKEDEKLQKLSKPKWENQIKITKERENQKPPKKLSFQKFQAKIEIKKKNNKANIGDKEKITSNPKKNVVKNQKMIEELRNKGFAGIKTSNKEKCIINSESLAING